MSDTVQAYILMTVEIGKTDEVLTELRKIDEAVRVSVTTGGYDIIVLIEVPDLEGLYNITIHRIHKIPGIYETTTAVVEKMISV